MLENLPDWAASIITVGVGLSLVLAVLIARPIARLIYRALGPRPEVAPEPEREPMGGEPVRVAAPQG
jgi:hypothetical protein